MRWKTRLLPRNNCKPCKKCWTVLKRGRRGSETSSVLSAPFATLSSRCILFVCDTSIPPPCHLLQVPHKSSLLSPPGGPQKHPPVLWAGTWPILLAVPPTPAISPRIFFLLKISLDFLTWVLPYSALALLCFPAHPHTWWCLFHGASYPAAAGPCTTGARVSTAVRGRRGVRASLVAEGRRKCEGTAGGMGRMSR